MSSDSSGRRPRNPLRLMVRPAEPAAERGSAVSGPSALPGWTQSVLTGLATGAGGLLLICLPVLLTWFIDRRGGVGSAVGAATQIWLLAHGGGLHIGGVSWTLAPLGITLLLVCVVAAVSRRLLRRQGLAGGSSAPPVVRTLASFAGAYAAVALCVGLSQGSLTQTARAVGGALLLAAAGSAWGSYRALGGRLLDRLPGWARSIPVAAATGVGVLLAGGAVALTVSIVLHRERVTAIADGLGAEGVNAGLLVGAQLLFWPNLLVWAATWVLGSGFTMGDGTVVSPVVTDLGLLPSIPVFGALPAEGAGHWVLSWSLIGVVAGIMIGLVVLRRRPAARLDETVGVGFLASVTALAALALLAVLSTGDLGEARLAGLGPRLVELLVIGSAVLIMPAVTVGLIGGVVRHFRAGRAAGSAAPAALDEESEIRTGDRVSP